MTKIIANVVGRNESNKYLNLILSRLKEQVDIICFTDDASNDDTADIARSHGCLVNVMPEPTFMHDEGKLRQASWDFLDSVIEKQDPDNWWVLAIDCDELLYQTTQTLHQIADNNHYQVANIIFFHMWNETQYRNDKAWRPHNSSRFFKYYPGGRFATRALACGSEPTYVQNLIQSNLYMRETGLYMKHLSYIKDEDKKAKYDRYMNIDGGLYHSNQHIISIMDTDPELVDWVWQGGGPE